MTDGISICVKARGLTGVPDLSVKLQGGDQRGGTYWVELRLLFSSPSGLSQWPSVPFHGTALNANTPPATLRINPSASRTFPISLSALQQLPNSAGPDNRLPCQLQVCQPWACQITVSVNSWGGRVE